MNINLNLTGIHAQEPALAVAVYAGACRVLWNEACTQHNRVTFDSDFDRWFARHMEVVVAELAANPSQAIDLVAVQAMIVEYVVLTDFESSEPMPASTPTPTSTSTGKGSVGVGSRIRVREVYPGSTALETWFLAGVDSNHIRLQRRPGGDPQKFDRETAVRITRAGGVVSRHLEILTEDWARIDAAFPGR